MLSPPSDCMGGGGVGGGGGGWINSGINIYRDKQHQIPLTATYVVPEAQ